MMLRFIGGTTTRSILKNNNNTIKLSTNSRSITSSKLTINNHTTSSPSINIPKNKEDLQFGKVFSTHMLQIPYMKNGGGWQSPEIVPFQELKLSPAASSLHYGKKEGDEFIECVCTCV
jgi:hypothetical protein